MFNLNVCWWLDSNCIPLELEATALPTEPQLLPHYLLLYSFPILCSFFVKFLMFLSYHNWPLFSRKSPKMTFPALGMAFIAYSCFTNLTQIETVDLTSVGSCNDIKVCPKQTFILGSAFNQPRPLDSLKVEICKCIIWLSQKAKARFL